MGWGRRAFERGSSCVASLTGWQRSSVSHDRVTLAMPTLTRVQYSDVDVYGQIPPMRSLLHFRCALINREIVYHFCHPKNPNIRLILVLLRSISRYARSDKEGGGVYQNARQNDGVSSHRCALQTAPVVAIAASLSDTPSISRPQGLKPWA